MAGRLAHLGGRGAQAARAPATSSTSSTRRPDRRRRPARPGRARATTIARRTRRRRPSSRRTSMRPGPDAVGRGRRGHAVEPDQAGLGDEVDPGAGVHPARTSAISAHTSSADPPSSAWMKLACLGDTSAVPSRRPLHAGRVDQAAGRVARRVGEHRPGVLAARLVLPAPPHDLGDLGLAGGAVARRERQLGPHDERARRRSTSRGSGGPGPTRARSHPRRPARSTHADPRQAGGHVRAVPAGVHAHRAADRAGHADRPLEPGQPASDASAGPPPAG